MTEKKTILILIDWYLPGRKAGGPVKSVESIIWALKDHFNFRIITTDTDLGESLPYTSVQSDQWLRRADGSEVYYMKKTEFSAEKLATLINSVDHHALYLNSFYSKNFSILPLQLRKKELIKSKIILAPRGMLSEGALRIKTLKKKVFIRYSKFTGLHKNILWHATYDQEVSEIRSFYPHAEIRLCRNFSKQLTVPDKKRHKVKGELNLFYLGRVSKVKNLHIALQSLAQMKPGGSIRYDIYGNAEDETYLSECKKLADQVPSGITVRFMGELSSEIIPETLGNYHFLFLPTSNENFGHSIFESLQCGCPVIISDKTPWRNLTAVNCGWDLPALPESYTRVLNECLEMDENRYTQMSVNAMKFASQRVNQPDDIQKGIHLFN